MAALEFVNVATEAPTFSMSKTKYARVLSPLMLLMFTLERSNSTALQTWKGSAEVPVFGPTLTLICPVVAPAGAVAVIWVGVELVTVAATPLNNTTLYAGLDEKFVPAITTGIPADPMVGEKLVMVGINCKTEKLPADVAVAVPIVSDIVPEVAFRGTSTVSCVDVELITVVAVPLKLTKS